MKTYLYCNYNDTSLDIPSSLRYLLVKCHQTEPCIAKKEAIGCRVITVLSGKYSIYKIFYNILL